LAVVTVMKKTNDHAEPTQSRTLICFIRNDLIVSNVVLSI